MRDHSGERVSSGGMAQRIRAFDWNATALGPAQAWPQSLKTAVDVMLGCGFPAVLWAGPQATTLYNDAYDALLIERDDLGHAGLGALEPARAALAPALDSVRSGATVTFEDHPLPFRRDGAVEDGCFTLSCSPVRDEAGQVFGVFLILLETTERIRAGQARNLMVAELQHRVRNILAVIRSIVSRTAETSETVEDLSAHLDGRLAALARTQVLLTRSPGAGVDLEGLVRDELLAQVADDQRITIEGPEILLPPKAAEVMTLAVHELATNATKYGALSDSQGRIDIGWTIAPRDGTNWLRFEWREAGVKIAAAAPRRTGFGAVLIEQRVPYELMGAGALTFAPGGVHCEIAFPLIPMRSVLQTDAG
ncbi:sensor histidine kinase [Caulobacter sp. RHG1]|uniref:sensor histidine kinase n=1 Tax=Caulobacter sp. (strain RHG1) TaxID=2545762 RepID=UPI001551FA6A|nr:PAS domain-containing sensor histidine kinase [Caulobacter sp. RHG1]NQE64805.1 Signal transduction histidine kinase [Caulobacter sp. RHG1]